MQKLPHWTLAQNNCPKKIWDLIKNKIKKNINAKMDKFKKGI